MSLRGAFVATKQSPIRLGDCFVGKSTLLAMTYINMTLTWESTYAIALELRRQHKDVNIEDVTLQQIYQWTLELSEFEDDPSLANDDILYAIYQDWFEENING